MNYKTYAEAKIANPDSEIYCAMISNDGRGIYGKLIDIDMVTKSHYLCNPADYCSTVEEFLSAGFRLVRGDWIIRLGGVADNVRLPSAMNYCDFNDDKRYILSASALNGGCKIPSKTEQWTVYNNTLPLCELTDEQVGAIFRYGIEKGVIEVMDDNGKWWDNLSLVGWHTALAYRAKQKSERELFIDKSIKLVTPENYEPMNKMFGALFDAGARYKDLTQHFGENI